MCHLRFVQILGICHNYAFYKLVFVETEKPLLSPLGVSKICKKTSFLVIEGYITVQRPRTQAFCIRAWLKTTSVTLNR